VQPTIAVYISGHGFGHCTRTAVLLEALLHRTQVRLRVVTSCPRWLWPPSLRRVTTQWRAQPCDVGAIQHDDLSIDHDATARALDAWHSGYQARLRREIDWLGAGADLVLGDVPPLAFDAAERAGVTAVALANFSWDWIYQEMGFSASAREASRAYNSTELLLELSPCAPMPAFGHRLSLGIVGAQAGENRRELRRELGLQEQQSLVLLAFRRPTDPSFLRLPPPCEQLRYLWPLGEVTRNDVIPAPQQLRFAQLLVAADAVVAKPGYGIIADSALCGTRLLYTRRTGFPEDEVLLEWLSQRHGCAMLAADSLSSGTWRAALERLLDGVPPPKENPNGAQLGAEAVAKILAASAN